MMQRDSSQLSWPWSRIALASETEKASDQCINGSRRGQLHVIDGRLRLGRVDEDVNHVEWHVHPDEAQDRGEPGLQLGSVARSPGDFPEPSDDDTISIPENNRPT